MSDRLKAIKATPHDFKWSRADNPSCPHCGAEFNVHDEEAWELYDSDGGDHEVTCSSCGEEFTVSVHVSFSFSTDEQPDEDDDEEDDEQEGAAA